MKIFISLRFRQNYIPFALALTLLSTKANAQVQLGIGVSEFIFNANATAAPQTGTVYSIPASVNQLTWNISFASAPGSQTTILEFSNDNSTWVTGDTSTNVSGESRNIFNASRFVRATESARSGGGAITVTIVGKSGFPIAFQPGAFNLFSDAANEFDLRNGTNNQTFYLYNTYTDASNFRRLKFAAIGTTAQITTDWAGSGTSWDLRIGNSITITGASGLVTSYNGGGGASNTTVGQGLTAIRGAGRSVGATAAVASISTYTVGVTDGTFEVSANILITTATTHTFNVTCSYTDEGNTARVVTLNFSTIAGVISNAAITNVAGAVPYEGVPLHIRAKAATTITIGTTGTFTSVVYNAEGIIKQVS